MSAFPPGPKFKKGGAKIAPPKLGAKAPKAKSEFWGKSPRETWKARKIFEFYVGKPVGAQSSILEKIFEVGNPVNAQSAILKKKMAANARDLKVASK